MAKVYDNPEHYDNGKMSPKEWIEHIWYHYKWVIIFGGLIVLFVIISFSQLFSKKDADINILHVGPMFISPEAGEKLEETVAGMGADSNGDGEVNVSLYDITINKYFNSTGQLVNYDESNEGERKFQTQVRAGDAVIYLLDEPYFRDCLADDLLTPLSEIVDDAYMPENVIAGCGVLISDLDAYSLPGLSSVPETAILCIRRSPNYDEVNGRITYGRSPEVWESNRVAFVNIIEYKDPEKQEEQVEDISIMHAGSSYIIPDAMVLMRDTVKVMGKDMDGDGEILVGVSDIVIDTALQNENMSEYTAAVTKYSTELSIGDSIIYLLDETYFQNCITDGMLTPFSEIFEAKNMPEKVISDYGIRISDLDISSQPGFASLPRNTILCLRRSPDYEAENGMISYGRTMEAWENNLALFIELIQYTEE